MTANESLMAILEQTADAVAAITGMKKQLIDQGWSEEAAEKIIVHWIVNAKG